MGWIGLGYDGVVGRTGFVFWLSLFVLGICLGRGVLALDQVDVLGWGVFVFVGVDWEGMGLFGWLGTGVCLRDCGGWGWDWWWVGRDCWFGCVRGRDHGDVWLCVCRLRRLIWKSKVSWSNIPNMFLPVLLTSPVHQNRSGTGCRMVRPWTAKRNFRKAGTWPHFSCRNSNTRFDLREFQQPLEGIVRPTDLAWAAVAHAPILLTKWWNPWKWAVWIWYACSTLWNNMPRYRNWQGKKLLRGHGAPWRIWHYLYVSWVCL